MVLLGLKAWWLYTFGVQSAVTCLISNSESAWWLYTLHILSAVTNLTENVQFKMVSMRLEKPICALPTSLRSPPHPPPTASMLPLKQFVRLIYNGPLSSFQARSSGASGCHASLLQAIDGVLSLDLCQQVVSQVPHRHCRPSSDGCFAPPPPPPPPVCLLGHFPSLRHVQGKFSVVYVPRETVGSIRVGEPRTATDLDFHSRGSELWQGQYIHRIKNGPWEVHGPCIQVQINFQPAVTRLLKISPWRPQQSDQDQGVRP